ncbi:MAG: tRNA pseudouridine(13) synthase TruD [Candidatus Thorarchaeota archaeon]
MLEQEKSSITYSFKNNIEKEVEKFVGIEVYATSKINGIKGEYKVLYKDFIVKEIEKNGRILDIKEDYTSPSFSKELTDKFTTFNLVKINKDTFEAVKNISKALKIPYNFFSYSGLKDKQAISVQKISVKGNYVEKLKNLKLRDIFIRNVYPTKKPVKLGSHLGNSFTITIRNLENVKEFKQNIEKNLKFLRDFGFPNYFGLQRFGNYRPNSHIIGRFLLKGDYENAFKEYVSTTYSTEPNDSRKVRSDFRKNGDLEKAYNNFPKILGYERNMIQYLIENENDYQGAINTLPIDLIRLLISSFQSYLFNRMLSLRIKKGLPLFKPVKGDVICILDDYDGNITEIKYAFGGMYDKYLKKALKSNRASIVLPIIGKNTILEDYPIMKSIFNEIAKLDRIDENIFHSKYINESEFKGSIRAMTVKPKDLKMLELTDDEYYPGRKKVKIEFSLQKGTYATMLLRELLK